MSLVNLLTIISFVLFIGFFAKIITNYFERKNQDSIYEKAKKQRIAIENHSNLWFKVLEMANSQKLPTVDSEEWLKLNKECVENDYNYEKNGMSPQSVNLLFIRLSYEQRERRLKIEKEYKFHWGEILKMIRDMNFPEKYTPKWNLLMTIYHFLDLDYLKYTGEKGELENTFRRMTE